MMRGGVLPSSLFLNSYVRLDANAASFLFFRCLVLLLLHSLIMGIKSPANICTLRLDWLAMADFHA